jgi:hypothetical protein
MKRSLKGSVIAKFLTGHTGIPFLRWNGETSTVDAPPPYFIKVTTDAASWRFFQAVKDCPDGVSFVVRYDNFIDGIEDAVVGMRLSSFVSLLETHYNTIADRIATFTEGE